MYPSPKIVNIHEIVHINRKHVTCKPHIVVRKIIITRTSLSRQNAPNRAECWEFDATIKSHKCCTLVKLRHGRFDKCCSHGRLHRSLNIQIAAHFRSASRLRLPDSRPMQICRPARLAEPPQRSGSGTTPPQAQPHPPD